MCKHKYKRGVLSEIKLISALFSTILIKETSRLQNTDNLDQRDLKVTEHPTELFQKFTIVRVELYILVQSTNYREVICQYFMQI